MTQAVFDPSAARTTTGVGRIAFVHALWRRDIVLQAHEGFVEEMTSLGFDAGRIDRFEAPGAFEIPLLAQRPSSSTAASIGTSSSPRRWSFRWC